MAAGVATAAGTSVDAAASGGKLLPQTCLSMFTEPAVKDQCRVKRQCIQKQPRVAIARRPFHSGSWEDEHFLLLGASN